MAHEIDLSRVIRRFPDDESCIEYLEKSRWADHAKCPHCDSGDVARKADGKRVGRWNCYKCKSSFNVLSGTPLQRTKVPLHKWFLAVALIANAENELTADQLAADLDLNRKTAWFLRQRIRRAMEADAADLLSRFLQLMKSKSPQ